MNSGLNSEIAFHFPRVVIYTTLSSGNAFQCSGAFSEPGSVWNPFTPGLQEVHSTLCQACALLLLFLGIIT